MFRTIVIIGFVCFFVASISNAAAIDDVREIESAGQLEENVPIADAAATGTYTYRVNQTIKSIECLESGRNAGEPLKTMTSVEGTDGNQPF